MHFCPRASCCNDSVNVKLEVQSYGCAIHDGCNNFGDDGIYDYDDGNYDHGDDDGDDGIWAKRGLDTHE